MADVNQFNYFVSGDSAGKPPKRLVFLHGLLGSAANWRRITPAFEDEFEVLIYDQRGHGKSFQPSQGYAPEDFANDLVSLLDELNWQKVYLVGHSMGGRNALNFAYRFPERVEKLVIEDIGPDGNRESSFRIEKLITSVPVPFTDKAEARHYFQEKFSDKDLGNYFYSNLKKTDEGNYDWRFSLKGALEALEKGRVRDRWHEVEGLKVPTLVVRGEHSPDLSVSSFKKMIELNKNIQGKTIADSGHWVHFDQPEEFIDALKTFFRS